MPWQTPDSNSTDEPLPLEPLPLIAICDIPPSDSDDESVAADVEDPFADVTYCEALDTSGPSCVDEVHYVSVFRSCSSPCRNHSRCCGGCRVATVNPCGKRTKTPKGFESVHSGAGHMVGTQLRNGPRFLTTSGLAAGRKVKGAERLLKYHTPDSIRQHFRTHLKRKSADYAHQLVAQSQSLAQPMDVDGQSTSTPKNKKQRKAMDRRMSAITSEGVRDLFGGDEGKSFPKQASGISAAELEKMKKEKEKQFENDPRTSSVTSSGLLDLFGYRCRQRAARGLEIHFASELCDVFL